MAAAKKRTRARDFILGLGDDVCLQERCQLASDADGVDMGLFYRATFSIAHVELAKNGAMFIRRS